MSDAYLITYLNDHLAGSVAGIDLAKRCLSNNRGADLAEFLPRLISILKLEQQKLKKLIAAAGGYESTAKKMGGWAIEKLGRFKPNGSFFKYTDLDRLVELEALVMGLEAQLSMWVALENTRGTDARFEAVDFAAARNDVAQLSRELKQFHTRAAETTFAIT